MTTLEAENAALEAANAALRAELEAPTAAPTAAPTPLEALCYGTWVLSLIHI